MQNVRSAILRHVRVPCSAKQSLFIEEGNALGRLRRHMCAVTTSSSDDITTRVIGLVKKFDKIDAAQVTETASFEKDLSLDSLDKVELIMAFEQEFSIEIPDEAADKFTCCADVAKYIASGGGNKIPENS
ncbi:PREDICTED: acyl carrier protein 3, mitochondrial isoform X2 [Nelumbo nucifera]|uniref:Acyl carrier protein n=1 Tax=Nelumbo nucifera TaxID=4432 RepID=A0A1U8AUR1_NELNU|nr:PREDICTED: acyl carrier protein 3, mitochondrial isoform X2 [Nelumbo nucifera]